MNEQTCILCVDDEKNVLRAMERIFLDDDYEILSAPSGEEGLAILEETPQVQVVISDYRMPGMNGVDFLREVFARRPDTIRIVLSGYADTAAVVSAINEGKIYKFIPKPWNDDELRLTVSKALETFAIQHRNVQLTDELSQKNEELSRLNTTLERLVQERTAELLEQNRALVRARNVLEHLPVGVVGVGATGLIVQLNQEAESLFGCDGGLVGREMREVLPLELSDLLSEVCATRCAVRTLEVKGVRLRVKALAMEGHEEDGVIMVVKRIY